MKRVALVIVALALAGGVVAAQDLERLFRTAENMETVDRNCKGAIDQYKQVAAGRNRALAAQALLRMGGCYQKLGDAQAERIYTRIVNEYRDQGQVFAQAQARLTDGKNAKGEPGISLRKVSAFGGGSISEDGRWLVYTVYDEPFSPSVIRVRDLVTGAVRHLTREAPGEETSLPLISRDGTQLVYVLAHGPYELRIASLAGKDVPSSRTLFGGRPEVQDVMPMDWSRDGKWIAALVTRNRTKQIGVVSVPEGKLRVLESVDWNGRPAAMRFSPDGHYLAFDAQVKETADRHVFVMALDASHKTEVAASPGGNKVLGWTQNGSHLLFTSNRSGTTALWAQRMTAGTPEGAPELLKTDIGDVYSLGSARNGGLYLGLSVADRDIEVASVDLATGKQIGTPVKLAQRFTGTNTQPAWSPDGKSLAYLSQRTSERVLAIRSMETGNTSEVPLHMDSVAWLRGMQWAPRGTRLTAFGVDRNGRGGFFAIDPSSGEVSRLAPFTPQGEGWAYEGALLSPDEKKMYYHTRRGWIRERDLASGAERLIVAGGNKSSADQELGRISLSSDGHLIASFDPAYRASDGSTRFQSLVLIPVDGGSAREIFRVNQPEWLDDESVPWTPDGRALIVRKMTTARTTNPYSNSEVWLVPVDGRAPRRLDVFSNHGGTLHMSPDGRQLATTTAEDREEVWLLENIVPSGKAQ